MKIVRIDNFDREGPGYDDKLIAENVHEHYGKKIVNLLNNGEHRESSDFYTLQEDEYKLKEFQP